MAQHDTKWTGCHHLQGKICNSTVYLPTTEPIKQQTDKTTKWKWGCWTILMLLLIGSAVWYSTKLYDSFEERTEKAEQKIASLSSALKSINRTIAAQDKKIQKLSRPVVATAPTKKKAFAAISFSGDHNEIIESHRGRSYPWKQTLLVGDIAFNHGYVDIKRSGYYYVYAQMFFFENVGHFKGKSMDFYIEHNRTNKIAVASVPLNSCKHTCTRHVGRLIYLKKDDHLYLSSYGSGIKFRMSPDKSYFGVYMVSDGISPKPS